MLGIKLTFVYEKRKISNFPIVTFQREGGTMNQKFDLSGSKVFAPEPLPQSYMTIRSFGWHLLL